jgi:hypothetical protein
MEHGMRWVAAVLSVALVGGSAVFAYVVARAALIGTPLGEWSADPVVWWGELILAACGALVCAAATVVIVRRLQSGSAGSAETMLRVGLGFLAVGALSITAGWLGLRAPTTPGTDFLERGELVFILFGVITGAFGALVTLPSLIASGRRGIGTSK